jgi:uncharacterized protein YndB with AHSA1/START domain
MPSRSSGTAPPACVFAAWSTAEAKSRWFHGPEGWTALERMFDFQVGGHERLVGHDKNGVVTNERIIYSYDMKLDDRRISATLATIEFRPAGKGTLLTITEQGNFVDGYADAGSPERGTQGLLENLAAALA